MGAGKGKTRRGRIELYPADKVYEQLEAQSRESSAPDRFAHGIYSSIYTLERTNLLAWTVLDEHRWRDLTASGGAVSAEGDAVLELRNRFSSASNGMPCNPVPERIDLIEDDQERIGRALSSCIHGDTELSQNQMVHAQNILGIMGW